jgi:hypothetical protein
MSDQPRKRGRPPIGLVAMSNAERQRRFKDRKQFQAEAIRILGPNNLIAPAKLKTPRPPRSSRSG